MFYYTLADGTKIKVGRQNFRNETVPVTIEGETIDCPMYSDEDGDIGFICREEEILFHWLKTS